MYLLGLFHHLISEVKPNSAGCEHDEGSEEAEKCDVPQIPEEIFLPHVESCRQYDGGKDVVEDDIRGDLLGDGVVKVVSKKL